MKIDRIGMTITLSPNRSSIDLSKLDDAALKKIMFEKAQHMTVEEFSEDIVIWHTSAGSLEEEVLQDDSIEKCDRAVIATMDREKAAVILNHPQTIQAMLMVFSQLMTTPDQLAGEVAGEKLDEMPEAQGKKNKLN